MNKAIPVIAAAVIAIGVAWYAGVFGGGGLGDDVLEERLSARQQAHIAAGGTDLAEGISVRTFNANGSRARFVTAVGEMSFEDAQPAITMAVCSDVDFAELINGGAEIDVEVKPNVGEATIGEFTLTSCTG